MLKMVVDQHNEEFLKIEDILKKQQSRLEVFKKLSDRTGLKYFPVLPQVEDSTSADTSLKPVSKIIKGPRKSPLDLPNLPPVSSKYATREVLLDFSKNEEINFDLKQEFIRKNCSRSGEVEGSEVPVNKSSALHLVEEQGTNGCFNFLPGDCLIEVNGRNVEDMSTSKVWELISRCKAEHDKVLLKVRPLPELNELSVRTGADGSEVPIQDLLVRSGTLKRSGSLRMKRMKMEVKQEAIFNEPSNFEVVWVKHKDGFTSAVVVGRSSTDENKVKVRLDQGQVEMEVDQSDVEEANPAAYDRIENLSSLRFVNESSCLHTLRHRYHSNLTHTFAGDALVVVNPILKLCIYSEKVMSMFRGCNVEDAIPHIYATAQASYSSMVSSRKDQAVLLMGPSGGGKTTNLFHLLHYYAVIASPSASSSLSSNRIKGVHLNAACTLMEAFGNCRTILNLNATRFVHVVKASFDKLGYLSGLTFQAIHLEKNRLSRRPEGEPTFHVFYQMLAGVDAKQRKDLHLDRIHDPNILMTPLQKSEDQQTARNTWAKITSSMGCLGFGEHEVQSILLILAAIFHIGAAGVIRGEDGQGFQFARPAAGKKAASLLGCTLLELSKSVFGKNQSNERKESETTGFDLVGQFVGDLYFHLFQFVIFLINRHLSPLTDSSSSSPLSPSILIVDPPGFQDPQICGRQAGADLFDLECNYITERLECFCHELLIASRLRLYKEELNETYPTVDDSASRERVLRFLTAIDGLEYKLVPRDANINGSNLDDSHCHDNNNNNVDNTIQGNVNNSNNKKRPSLFQILQDAPNPLSTVQLSEALRGVMPPSKTSSKDAAPLPQASLPTSSSSSSSLPSSSTITINHLYETMPIQYNVHGWVKYNRQVSTADRMRSCLLRSSSHGVRNTCFLELISAVDVPSYSSSTSSLSVTSSSSSSSSPSASSSSSSSSKNTQTRLSLLIQDTNALLDELGRRETRFVFCWQPCHRSKSSSSSSSSDSNNTTTAAATTTTTTTTTLHDSSVDMQLLRSQWKASCLLQASQLHQLSYPEHYHYDQFVSRFAMLRPPEGLDREILDNKKMTEMILKHQSVDPSTYKFGKTKMFFRSGALSTLNVLCDDAIARWVVILQSCCRGMLARRKISRLKVKAEAIMCIQEAVRSHLELRRWKWWKLFDKVRRVAKFCSDNPADFPGSPFMHGNGLRFEDGTNTSDLITDSIIGDYSFNNHTGEDFDHHLLHHSTPLSHRHHQQQQQFGDETLRKMRMKHSEEMEDMEILASCAERKMAHVSEDASDRKTSLETFTKELKAKNSHLRQLNGLIEEKVKENEDLKGLQRRMERDAVGKVEMLNFVMQQKEQLLEEIKRLEQDKLIAKQQLEDALYDLSKETGKRRDAEVRMNLYCGANDEYEKTRTQNEDLLKEKKKHLQRLENQENTIKKLIETISELEEKNCQAKQALIRMERRNEDEGRTANSLKEIQATEMKMKELLKEKDDRMASMASNEVRLKKDLDDCEVQFKIRERKLRGRMKKLTEVLGDDQSQKEKPNRLIKMLRSKIEDMEVELETMRRLKRGVDGEVAIVQGQLGSALEDKKEMEERNRILLQANSELQSQIEEREDECNDLAKKYSNLVQKNSLELDKLKEQSEELESLREKSSHQSGEVQLLEMKLAKLESTMVNSHVVTRLEARMAELKTNMEMDAFARKQAESHVQRLKEVLHREKNDKVQLRETCAKKEEEVTSLQAALKHQKSRVICLEARLQDLEGLILQLRRKIDDQQEDCKGHKEEIGLLNRRITAIQSNASMYWVNNDDDDDDDEDISKILARGKVLLLSPRRSLLDSSEA